MKYGRMVLWLLCLCTAVVVWRVSSIQPTVNPSSLLWTPMMAETATQGPAECPLREEKTASLQAKEKTMSKTNVIMYRTKQCPYCVRAHHILEQQGVEFEEVYVDDDAELRSYMIEKSGRRTVPQIFIGERPIGGCDDLVELVRSGQFLQLLGEE